MTFRRTSVLLGFLVVAAGAGCVSTSGSQGGAYGMAGGYEDCANLYPPMTTSYPNQYYPSNYDDGPCSAYPRGQGYYPEYVVQTKTDRQVTTAESRSHRTTRLSRPDDSGWGTSGSGYSDSSSSGMSGSGGVASVPRMDPIPVNSPSPSSGSPGPGTVSIQPREH